jgi:HK97 gp10 family phage protein
MSNYESHIDDAKKVIKTAGEKALNKIGAYVEGQAKLRTPVDTGHLRRSIFFKTESDKVTIGTNVEYAIYVEKGTKNMQAHPYLTPAVEENIKTLSEIAKGELRIE